MILLVSGLRQKVRNPLSQSNLMLSWKEGQIDREANVQKSSHLPLPGGAFPSAKPLNFVLIPLAAPFLRCPLVSRNTFALSDPYPESPAPSFNLSPSISHPYKYFFVLTKKLVS